MLIEYRNDYNTHEKKYLSCTYIRFGSEQGIGNTVIAYNVCDQYITEIPINLIIEISNEID